MRQWTCVAILVAWGGASVSAQQPLQVVIPAGNVLLPNSNSVPLGPNAGLEGGAQVARVGDPSSAWLNPAGLSRAQDAEISASSGVFQVSTLSTQNAPGSGGSVVRLPSLVGFMVKGAFGGKMTLGLSVATVTSWSQDTDVELVTSDGPAAQRFAFSADSSFNRFVVVGSAGYVTGKWRFGGGLAVVQTELVKNAVASTRATDSVALRSLLLESRVSGTAFHLRPVLGVQYDASPRLKLGFMARTPAPAVYSSGSITAEGVRVGAGTSTGLSFFDPDADFTAKLPFEMRGGAAYIGHRFEIEVDLSAETPTSSYEMFASDETVATYAGGPGAPVVATSTFPGVVSQSTTVVNVAVGGHVLLSDNGLWRLHFGAGTDRSGVGADDQLFTKVHFGVWSVGVSGRKGRLQFTAGFNYRSGTADDVIIGQLDSGTLVQSGIHVRSVGLIYAVNYRF